MRSPWKSISRLNYTSEGNAVALSMYCIHCVSFHLSCTVCVGMDGGSYTCTWYTTTCTVYANVYVCPSKVEGTEGTSVQSEGSWSCSRDGQLCPVCSWHHGSSPGHWHGRGTTVNYCLRWFSIDTVYVRICGMYVCVHGIVPLWMDTVHKITALDMRWDCLTLGVQLCLHVAIMVSGQLRV